MILSRLTWQDVESLSREIVVLVPTGSLEQHGPHLPLFTDSMIATAVAEAVEHLVARAVGRDPLPVDALVEVGAGLLPRAYVGQESPTRLLDRDRLGRRLAP